MAKSMLIFATALALSAMSAEVLARGGGGGGGGSSSKSAQSSSSTMKAPGPISAGTATGKRMHKPFTVTTQSGRASLLRGNNGNSQKGGRYLASTAKKLPGTRKTSTVTLKRGITPEKVEAGSENVRRVK